MMTTTGYEFLSCELDQQPNLLFLVREMGRGAVNNETPKEVYERIAYLFTGYIDQDWLITQLKIIQMNWLMSGIVVGAGWEFPLTFK